MLRALTASAFKLNVKAVDPWFALRCSFGVAICLVAGLATGSPLYALAAGMGAMSTGFVSNRGIYLTRLATMLGTAAGMAISTLVGALASGSIAATVIVTAFWAYAYGIIASLGDAAAAVALNSAIALVIFVSIPLPGSSPWMLPLFVFAGGVVQAVLVVVFWPAARSTAERRALSEAYRSLSAYVRANAGGNGTLPPSGALNNVRAALADPHPLGRRAEFAALQTLADEAERIRGGIAWRPANGAADTQLAQTAAQALDEIADALQQGRAPAGGEPLWKHADAALEHADRYWHTLFGQIRGAWRSAAVPTGKERTRIADTAAALTPHVDDWWPTLRGNLRLDSPFGRHAIRLSVTLAAAMILYRAGGLPRGYWVALTALLVLRPDFTTTFTRGVARVGGTLAGSLLASLIALAVPHTPAADAALAIAFASLGYVAININYALYSLTITSYVVFILALAGLPEHEAVVDRIVATVIGGAVAGLTYLLWPTWESSRVREQIADLLQIDLEYSQTILAAYAEPAAADVAKIRRLQYAAWSARANAQASVERMLSEPRQSGGISSDDALALLAASQRFGLGNLALYANLTTAAKIPRPPLHGFAAALGEAMQSLIAAVREGTPPTSVPPLRDAYVAAARELKAAKDDPDAEIVAAQCDLFVDSVNTMLEIAARRL